MGELDLLIENGLHRGVLNGYHKGRVRVVGDRAVQIGAVIYHTVGPVVRLDTRVLMGQEVDHFLILIEVGIKGLYMSQSVVIGDILPGGTSHCVVMLIDAHRVEEGVSGSNN